MTDSTTHVINKIADESFVTTISAVGATKQPDAIRTATGEGIAWRWHTIDFDFARGSEDSSYGQAERAVRLACSYSAFCKSTNENERLTDEAKKSDRQAELAKTAPLLRACEDWITKNLAELETAERQFYAPPYPDPKDAAAAITDWEIRQHINSMPVSEQLSYLQMAKEGGHHKIMEAMLRGPLPLQKPVRDFLDAAYRELKNDKQPDQAKYFREWRRLSEESREIIKQAQTAVGAAANKKPDDLRRDSGGRSYRPREPGHNSNIRVFPAA